MARPSAGCGAGSLLQSTIDALPEHIAILDSAGTIRAVNSAWRRFGLENGLGERAVGVGVTYFTPVSGDEPANLQTGMTVAEAHEGIRRVLRGEAELFEFEYPCPSPITDRWFACRVRGFAEDGERYAVVAHRNISTEKQAETRALESAEENRKLALVAATTTNSVIITDRRGRIEWVNTAFERLTGYTCEEAVGCTPGELLQGPETDRETVALMRRQLARGRGFEVEILNYRKDRTTYWLAVSVQPVYGQSGGLTNFIAIQTDITARKMTEGAMRASNAELLAAKALLERQARELQAANADLREANAAALAANRAKTDFLANMSHEIRTPMTAILGYTDLLAESDVPERDRESYVATIRRNAEHLLSIVNDILDLSKVEAGELAVERLVCRPDAIAADVVELLRPRAEEKGVGLRLEVRGEMPASLSDPTRLRQILTNLVGNAVKFTREGGVHVVVSVDEPRTLRFDVRDTGIGIAPDQAEQLFRPFHQLDASTTRRFGGTGLGLAISKRLASLLGGELDYQSEPEHGTVFTLRLPLHVPSRLPEIESRPAAELTGGRTRARVLVAEDGVDNQRLLALVLRKMGHEVAVANNGRSAVEMVLAAEAAGEPFDVLLMDIQMPEMDGYEATRTLRGYGFVRPIVALTAHAMSGDREKCIAAGCDDYVSKPVDRASLAAVIARWTEWACVTPGAPQRRAA